MRVRGGASVTNLFPTQKQNLKRFGRSDEGQTLVLTALALVMLMMMAGLGVDVGYLRYQKQQMQKAADAGALAGAAAFAYNGNWKAAAVADVNANGFTTIKNDGTSTGVTILVDKPWEGPFAGQAGYVEVSVSQPQPTFFMKVFLPDDQNTVAVRSWAVASALGSAPGCIYALEPAGSGALEVTGSVGIHAACSILIDSSDPSAFVKTGSGVVSAKNIGIVGGMSQGGSGLVKPTPMTSLAPFGDPLSLVTAPSPGTCTPQSGIITGSGTTTLQPATFCRGINISGSGTVIFTAGTYILEGGGLTVIGSARLVGNGVTFYNTGNSTYLYAPIKFTGSSVSTLSAPTSGVLAGILFFQDRSIIACCGPTTVNTIDGSSGAVITGALYFPTTPLKYAGSTTLLSPYTIMVAWKLEFAGSANTSIFVDYTSLPNGASPIHSSLLVE